MLYCIGISALCCKLAIKQLIKLRTEVKPLNFELNSRVLNIDSIYSINKTIPVFLLTLIQPTAVVSLGNDLSLVIGHKL